MQDLLEARDPTPEELELIKQEEAKENYVNKMVALPMPKQGSKIPLEGGGYTQIDPLLANKPFEAPVEEEARDITMDDILQDYETFKYFKLSGELKSKKGAGEMIMDGAKMIVEDMGHAAKTWPERFLSNFGITMLPLNDYISIPVIGTPSGMTSEQKKKFEEAKKRKRAKAVATQNQMLGDIKLNTQMLIKGGSRVIDMLTSDDDSEEDLRSSYEFWKKLNEVEKHRQTIYLENTASWMTAGLDPEIKEMILSGEVQPDRKAATGGSMIADPWNFVPFGAGLKGGSAFFNKIMRGPQIAMVNETKDAILKQAVIKKALELGEYAGKGAFGKGAEAAEAQIKALDGIILENLDKIQTMARPQREAMLRAAEVLPAGNPLKQLIQSEIKGIPVKGRRTFGGVVAGSGMVVTGKTIEGVGNAISFLKDLAPETAITIAMKMGIPEEKAVQLFQNGMASKLLKYGAAGSGTYALTDFLTDDEMLSTMATATVLGLPFLARYGRDAALLGRELMEPATELNYFQRLGANGREMITDRIIDRDTLFGTVRSTAEKSFKAGEGKLLNRILSPRGQLSTGTQGVVDMLNATKIGRTVESAGRLANQTAKGAAIGGSFGYVAGGGEQEEAMYGGIGGGSVFGGGAYTASKPFRMVGGKSAAEISQRRHGSYQYFVKNLLPSGMKESFSSMSKANQIAYANAAMSYKDTVFNFKSLGADGKGGRQYRVDGTAYIEVNTDSAWAIEPLLRHEITHYLEETGGSRQFTDLLLGNHLLEKKGIFTLVDDAGKPVMREDGKGYKTNKKLDDFKYEYGKFFFEPDKPRQEVIDLIPDDVIAREIVAEHGADFFLSDSRRYRDLHEGPTGALMRALVESPMLKNKTLLRSMIARLGGTFRADGTLQSPNGVFGQMQRIPAVTELIRKYNREIEGLSKEQVQKKFPIDEGQNVIDISGAEFAKNPELIEQLRAGTIMRVDENGNIVPDTAMTPAQQRKYNQDFSQALLDAVKRKDEADGLPAGHIREKENEKTKAISFEGRFIDESIIDEVASQGGWNKAQIDLFKEINLSLKNGTNAKGGSDWLISYFKATGKGGGRYVNAKVQHVLEVPYGIEITQKGNINIRTVNVDSLYKNIDKVFRQQQAEVTRLFGTSNPKDAFMDAMHQYHLNHGEGRHGWFNLDADPAIAKQKMNFINAMFGKSSKAHVDANPWLAALDSGAKSKQPRPVYRSRRIERIGKADQLTGQRHVDPVKIINNLMPPKAEDMVQARTKSGMETISTRDAVQRGDVDQINMSMAGRPQFFGKDKDGKFAFLDDALAKEGVEKLGNALKEKDMQKRITKGWEAVTNTSKAFKVPTTKSKNIERIVKQASGGKIVHRPFKNTDGEGFYLIRAEDDGLKNDQLIDYIFAYEDKLMTEIDGYGTLKVDSSSAPEQGKGFGFTAYQILLDYAAANDLVYAPSALSYINQIRSLSAMLSSALKHKSTKHLKPNVDNGFSRSEVEAFGKDYEQDVALLAMSELSMVRERFKEIDDFDYNFKTGKFSEFNKPITDKRLQEQLMADDRIDGTYPAEDGVGLTTAKRAIITNKLFLAQVKDQGPVTSKIFDTGNIDGIAYMPPKPPFQTISTDVIKNLEGDKNAIQAKLTMADYPENPYQDSVALPSRMGVVNNKVSGMFKSYDDVTNLINKLVDKIEYYKKKYPEFTKRTASFYSDMGKTAFDMAKFVPMKGRSQYDIADLQLRFLALGSPRSAVAANMTKSGRSIMGHYTGISGHKINPVDQQVAAQETALDWKAGKHFEVLDPDRKGASDKVRNFYLNGLAELIDLAKADTSEGAAKAASELMHRAAVTLDLIKPKEKLTPQLEAKLNKLLDGLATVDMWDMAAKEYAHPAYVIKSGRDTPNAKPFLWSIPKHRVISTMAESGTNWKAAKKDMKIDSAAEMNFQQANALQVDNINNWNETTWAERSKKGFGEETKWSYYKKNDEGGLTPQGGGPLYDAHQTVDGLIADMLNKRGHASFFGKQKLVARNAQEILWALTKFENPLESNQQLVLFGDRFQHFKQAMQPLLAGKGLDPKKISKEAQGILGAILDTYNKTADQKFPFEVDTWGDSANAKAVQDKIGQLGGEDRSLGVQKITDAVADQLGAEVQKIADQYGEELVVQNVQRGFGGYTEDGAAAVTPNISMTMRGNPETVRSVMMEISSALDQADGNVFRQPTIIELNDPKTKFNQTISFQTKGLTKQQQSDFFMDLNKLKDQDGEAFITGFTNTDAGMFIGDQYYKPNRLHDEIKANIQAIDKVMKKHKVKGFETHQLVAETFARGERTGPRSSFQRGVHNLIKSKVRNAQGRKYNGLPEVPSQLQRVIDGMHNLSKQELSSGELTKAKEGLASALDLLHIENIIDEDTHKARKDDLKEYTDKIKAKKNPVAPKIEKKLLQRLDDPKTTKSKKKNILWHMRSGYFGPTQFKNKAKKIMGEAKSMDLLSKEVRASAKSQNSYFTTPETSGKVKK